jgi:hypothetical protein
MQHEKTKKKGRPAQRHIIPGFRSGGTVFGALVPTQGNKRHLTCGDFHESAIEGQEVFEI